MTADNLYKVSQDSETQTCVVASYAYMEFIMFDGDGNMMWTPPDSPNLSTAKNIRSSVHLISCANWETFHGFEFAENEFVSALDCVQLKTRSNRRRLKSYYVIGTTISRGEDLATRGAVSLTLRSKAEHHLKGDRCTYSKLRR